jgi:serine/threonine-protein kinase
MSVAKNLESRSVLDGKYALLREIASGTSGTVYEAEHLVVGKSVALKLLNRDAFAAPGQREQFVNEARAAARIAHSNVVDIHDLGVTPDGVPYLAMELLRGETLHDMLEARGALPAPYACELMVQILAALSAAHAQGSVHGDLKPSNAMVTHPRPDRPQLKLLGFGIARRSEAVDAHSDLYAASALLYAMLAGRDPLAGSVASARSQRMLARDFAPLCQVNPQLPKSLATIVERGLALDPNLRIQSAEEYLELLQPFVGATGDALGPQRRMSSAPNPFVTTLREIEIQKTLPPERTPAESSVIPVRVASYARGVTDSLLLAPRFPRSANSPRMQIGRDFMPSPGQPGWAEAEERRLSTQAPLPARARRDLWFVLIATGIGFGLGVLIAWLGGAI